MCLSSFLCLPPHCPYHTIRLTALRLEKWVFSPKYSHLVLLLMLPHDMPAGSGTPQPGVPTAHTNTKHCLPWMETENTHHNHLKSTMWSLHHALSNFILEYGTIFFFLFIIDRHLGRDHSQFTCISFCLVSWGYTDPKSTKQPPANNMIGSSWDRT